MNSKTIEKPEYRVPSMEEIAERPKNGFSVVSTFSGCGGSCLGFEMAGFEVIWASEFIPAAQETYRLNHPDAILDTRDIRNVKPESILEATGLERGELDVLEGSPPCSSFSTAGKREAFWGKTKKYSDTTQRTDDLFFEYSRIVEGLQPKVFIAENVSGLVKGSSKGYFKEIMRKLKACGYKVKAQLLDAQWLGVPQARQRVIFIGVREDLAEEPAFPKPLPYRYSVRDALPHVVNQRYGACYGEGGMRDAKTAPSQAIGTSPSSGNGSYSPAVVEVERPVRITGRTGPRFQRVESELDKPMNSILVQDPHQTRYEVETEKALTAIQTKKGVRSLDEPSPTVQTHGNAYTQSELTLLETDISRYAIGKEWDKLGPGESSSKFFNLSKPDENKPSPTVTQAGGNLSAASVTHPTERRKFYISELKRICAFPDDFELTGTYAQQWERLGRSVPPLMMRAVAEVVRDEILEKI